HDAGDGAFRRRFLGDQAHLAVVEQKRVPRLQRGKDFRMRELNAGVVARSLVGIEDKTFAVVELDRAFGERAQAEFWALQIDQNTDRAAVARLDVANGL